MDYLQEGIHLRAMGQKDPLVEWQREGFEMFGAMMHGIAQDFVKYVMHAQVTVAAARAPTPAGRPNMQYSAPDDPSAARLDDGRRGRGPQAAEADGRGEAAAARPRRRSSTRRS